MLLSGKTTSFAFIISMLNISDVHLFAQQNQNKANELYDLSLNELAKIKVLTASNRFQYLTKAPVTIYVITEEDIKQCGYRDL